MALTATTVFTVQPGVGSDTNNGGNFDPSNANMSTNGSVTSGTTNSPVFSSVSYTFVAGDVGNYVFIQAGTNWNPGFYKITSVSAGAATINATIGAAIINNASGFFTTNTVAGCVNSSYVSSTASATWTVDYSWTGSPTAANTLTGLTSAGAGLVVLCTTAGVNMIGNGIQITGGTNFNTGVYNVSSVVVGTSLTLVGAGNSDSGVGAAGTANVGGAFASPVEAASNVVAGNIVKLCNVNTYTVSSTITISTAGTATSPIKWIGYNSSGNAALTVGNYFVMNSSSAATNQITFSSGTYNQFYNIELSNGKQYALYATNDPGPQTIFVNSLFTGMTSGVANAGSGKGFSAQFYQCTFSSTVNGFLPGNSGNLGNYFYCTFSSISGTIFDTIASNTGPYVCMNCIFSGNGTCVGGATSAITNQIVSNTFYNNTTAVALGSTSTAGSFLNIVGNIIIAPASGTSYGIRPFGGDANILPLFADYNCYYSNGNGSFSAYGGGSSSIVAGVHDITSNPNLTNPGGGNYAPAPGSPVIGAGPGGTTMGAIGSNGTLPQISSVF